MPKISSGLSQRTHCRTSATQIQKAMHADDRPAMKMANDGVHSGLLIGIHSESRRPRDISAPAIMSIQWTWLDGRVSAFRA